MGAEPAQQRGPLDESARPPRRAEQALGDEVGDEARAARSASELGAGGARARRRPRPPGRGARCRRPGAPSPSGGFQYGLRGLWSQTSTRPPGRATRTISPSVARTASGSAMWCIVATLSTRSKVSSSNGSVDPVAAHRARTSGAALGQHVEHPLRRVDAAHPRSRRPRGAGRGRRCRSRRRARSPARAVLDDEADALVEVVLDDVRRHRLVVLGRDPVEGGLAHGAGSPRARCSSREGRSIRRGVRSPEPDDQLDHPQADRDRDQRAARRRGGADARQVVDRDLDEAGAGGDRDQHHLRAGVVAADPHPLGDQLRQSRA